MKEKQGKKGNVAQGSGKRVRMNKEWLDGGGRVRIRLENDGKRAGRRGKPPNKPNESTRVVYQILFNL
jgi:hypothetical protein